MVTGWGARHQATAQQGLGQAQQGAGGHRGRVGDGTALGIGVGHTIAARVDHRIGPCGTAGLCTCIAQGVQIDHRARSSDLTGLAGSQQQLLELGRLDIHRVLQHVANDEAGRRHGGGHRLEVDRLNHIGGGRGGRRHASHHLQLSTGRHSHRLSQLGGHGGGRRRGYAGRSRSVVGDRPRCRQTAREACAGTGVQLVGVVLRVGVLDEQREAHGHTRGGAECHRRIRTGAGTEVSIAHQTRAGACGRVGQVDPCSQHDLAHLIPDRVQHALTTCNRSGRDQHVERATAHDRFRGQDGLDHHHITGSWVQRTGIRNAVVVGVQQGGQPVGLEQVEPGTRRIGALCRVAHRLDVERVNRIAGVDDEVAEAHRTIGGHGRLCDQVVLRGRDRRRRARVLDRACVGAGRHNTVNHRGCERHLVGRRGGATVTCGTCGRAVTRAVVGDVGRVGAIRLGRAVHQHDEAESALLTDRNLGHRGTHGAAGHAVDNCARRRCFGERNPAIAAPDSRAGHVGQTRRQGVPNGKRAIFGSGVGEADGVHRIRTTRSRTQGRRPGG